MATRQSKKSQPARPQAPRRYTNTRRAAQAAQTRAEVLMAAAALFNESGWAGTTVAGIAERAGVAVETVYSGFGSKKALLRAACDVAVVGDAEPVPFIERPEARALGQGPRDVRMQAGMAILAEIHERSAGVMRAVWEASSGDDEIARWATELEQARRQDVRRSLELILEREIDDVTLDLMWALYGPEVYKKLITDASWTRERYETQMLEASKRILGID